MCMTDSLDCIWCKCNATKTHVCKPRKNEKNVFIKICWAILEIEINETISFRSESNLANL